MEGLVIEPYSKTLPRQQSLVRTITQSLNRKPKAMNNGKSYAGGQIGRFMVFSCLLRLTWLGEPSEKETL